MAWPRTMLVTTKKRNPTKRNDATPGRTYTADVFNVEAETQKHP